MPELHSFTVWILVQFHTMVGQMHIVEMVFLNRSCLWPVHIMCWITERKECNRKIPSFCRA